jgi:hypothetical protein
MSEQQKFQGWFAFDKETGVGGMKWQEFEPKEFEETDVDIKITHCGMLTTPRIHPLVATLLTLSFSHLQVSAVLMSTL